MISFHVLLLAIAPVLGTGTERVFTAATDASREVTCRRTGRELDWFIEGESYFQITDPATGYIRYTRFGHFSLDADHNIVLGLPQDGRLLEPSIHIPTDVTAVVVSLDGFVSVKRAASPKMVLAGRIEPARFRNPDRLLGLGEDLFAETEESGHPITGAPGQDGFGLIRQGAIIRKELLRCRAAQANPR